VMPSAMHRASRARAIPLAILAMGRPARRRWLRPECLPPPLVSSVRGFIPGAWEMGRAGVPEVSTARPPIVARGASPAS
jgi:hypothetical protein